MHNLTTYIRAGYPAILLRTAEEARAEKAVLDSASALRSEVLAWSAAGLLRPVGRKAQPFECPDPVDLFRRLGALGEGRHIVLAQDLHLMLAEPEPELLRAATDFLRDAKSRGIALVMAGVRDKLAPELERMVVRIDLPLPGPAELRAVAEGCLAGLKPAKGGPRPPRPDLSAVVTAAGGLTSDEAENCFALSLTETGTLDPAVVGREKANAIRANGLLEVVDSAGGLEGVGGLDLLKEWMAARTSAFTPEAREFGLPAPKGLLIAGIPGTGKSLTAKASARALGVPLLRMDVGRLFGGLIGESEGNLRAALKVAEAVAPCVLWIDEIEKGFSGSRSSGVSDGGTTARVFGSFLSWMQEKEKPVFVVATANDVSALPPEFLRKGRFDEMFFVDLPDERERAAIWDIVIARRGRKPACYDTVVLARATATWTGAEIAQAYDEALHAAYAAKRRDPTSEELLAAIQGIVPLHTTMAEEIEAGRRWARTRCRPASRRDEPTTRDGSPRRLVAGSN